MDAPIRSDRRALPFRAIVAALLAAAAGLALWGTGADSTTFDEPAHLASGLAPLLTGDYRLSPDHPPLARMWAALPLLVLPERWPPMDTPAWHDGDFYTFSRSWLTALNDGDRLIQAPRMMMVVLLLALLLTIALTARRLCGPAAALLALFLAAFDPSFLAHGHYVTADIAFTLTALLALVAFARLTARPDAPRLLLAILALAAASLTKYSWALLLPALVLMAAIALLRRRPSTEGGTEGAETPRRRRLLVSLFALGVGVWVAIWGAYGFRSSPFRGPDRATAKMALALDFQGPRPQTQEEAWEVALHDPATGRPLPGPSTALLRFARDHRLLPEAYLYGLAYVQKKSLYRSSYLAGAYSNVGWHSYFPIAFLIKTPLATLLLLLAGAAALWRRRASLANAPVLAWGLLGFAVVYGVSAVLGHLDIGQRHLLPIYPFVFLVAGAAAAWLTTRAGRFFVLAACAWLLAGSLVHAPDFLPYFNELIGGTGNGYRFLVDSNLDWGQDMRRLAAWAGRHPQAAIKLDRFGDGPLPRGFTPELLWSDTPVPHLAPLDAGDYVVSATELVGVYKPFFRDAAWRQPEVLARYSRLARLAALPAIGLSPGLSAAQLLAARRDFDLLRRARLINRLGHRAPDERIGGSLFVYHLAMSDVDALTAP